MTKVIFKFDKEKDLWNHWHKSNWKSSWANFKIHPQVKKICKGKEFEECKEELASHLSKLQKSNILRIEINSLEESWRGIEKEFFKRMDKLMKNNFDKDIIAYLTTLGVCPYDPKEPSFMFSLFYSLPHQLKTCGHEIMHLYFHNSKYWKLCESKLGKEKTHSIKEALTEILNLEFKDLWVVEDKGYPQHKELRKFIKTTWKKKRDFDYLIDKLIERNKK